MALTKIPASLLSGVDLGDSVRVNLGTDNDLALFHTGGNGVIHNTTGELRIRANNLKLQDYTNEDLMIVATSDGSVDLYHNNQKKFETTSAGASVTGNLAVSGNLTVSGTTTELDTTNLNVTDKNITLNYNASGDTSSNANGAGLTIQDAVNGSTDATISWDASNDEFDFSHPVAIVNTVGGDTVLNLTGTYGAGNNVALLGFARSGGAVAGDIRYTDATTDMEIGTSTAHGFALKTAGNKRIRIDSSGRVGINQSVLGNNFALQVTGLGGGSGDARAVYLKGSGAHTNIGGTGPTLVLQNTNTTVNNIVKLSFESASSGETVSINAINRNHSSHYGDMAFNTRGSGGYSEKMRIMANGSIGIGTDNPSALLHLKSTAAGATPSLIFENTNNAQNMNIDYWNNAGAVQSRTQYAEGPAAWNFIPNTSTSNSALYIAYDGKVGIGTTIASNKFGVKVTSINTDERMINLYTGTTGPGKYVSIGAQYSETNLLSNSEIRFGNELQSSAPSFLAFATGNTTTPPERMRIDSEGNIGIGVTPKTDWHTSYPAIQIGQSSAFFANDAGDEVFMVQNARYTSGGWKYNSSGTAALFDMQSGNTRWRRAVSGSDNGTVSWADSMMILGTNGNVGIGVTAPAHLGRTGSGKVLHLAGDDCQVRLANSIVHHDNSGNTNLYIRNHYTTLGSDNNAKVTLEAGKIVFATSTGYLRAMEIGSNGACHTAYTGAVDTGGYFYAGKDWGAGNHRINRAVTQGNLVLVISAYNSSGQDTALFYGCSGQDASTSAAGLRMQKNSSTNRSINAAGTINASGSDYAEYVKKSDTCGTIAKGDICGIDTNSKLTDKWSEAHSFVVKSTDPSYVGGDTWGALKRPELTLQGHADPDNPADESDSEYAIRTTQHETDLAAFETASEAERVKYDRIAFSGQVPCNLTGASVGDYIIPKEGTSDAITGEAVSTPTFEQYQKAVGKVWKVLDNGKAWISVKIG